MRTVGPKIKAWYVERAVLGQTFGGLRWGLGARGWALRAGIRAPCVWVCVCFAFECVCFCVCVCVFCVCVCFAFVSGRRVPGSRGRAIYLAVPALPAKCSRGWWWEGHPALLSLLCALWGLKSMPCSGFVELSRAQFSSLCGFTCFTSTSIYPKDTEPAACTRDCHAGGCVGGRRASGCY